jgi:dihydrofolate synthase/folylpolyglutamate synthase
VINFLKIGSFEYTLPKLKGRFEYYKKNIIVDVGHNSLAATVIAKELEKSSQKFILVYNSYEDKDYPTILKILKPYLQEVQIISLEDKRVVSQELLEKTLEKLNITYKQFEIMNINEQNNYLVFGSFLVVEEFLKGMKRYEKR